MVCNTNNCYVREYIDKHTPNYYIGVCSSIRKTSLCVLFRAYIADTNIFKHGRYVDIGHCALVQQTTSLLGLGLDIQTNTFIAVDAIIYRNNNSSSNICVRDIAVLLLMLLHDIASTAATVFACICAGKEVAWCINAQYQLIFQY